jgi:hypothetical protein
MKGFPYFHLVRSNSGYDARAKENCFEERNTFILMVFSRQEKNSTFVVLKYSTKIFPDFKTTGARKTMNGLAVAALRTDATQGLLLLIPLLWKGDKQPV